MLEGLGPGLNLLLDSLGNLHLCAEGGGNIVFRVNECELLLRGVPDTQ